ncbi:MAG TPA: dephospho-CoA kinase [Rhodocyclaceae bacterium]
MSVPVIGLTGGIGSGKSTVADLFAARGAGVVDTDRIAHALTSSCGAAMPAIREAFGAALLADDGSLDRPAMRRLVYGEPAQRQRLEAILHPLIREQARAECAVAAGDYILLVVPLLAETGALRPLMRRVLVVDCDPAVQRERVMRRSGLAAAEADAIIAAQASREARLALADDVIVNDRARSELVPQVDRLHALYCRVDA